MKNKALLIHHDYFDIINILNNEEAGILLKALLRYDRDGAETDFDDRTLFVIFSQLKRYLDSNRDKYEKISQARSENAKKRWEKVSENTRECNCMQTDAPVINTNTNTNTNSNSNENVNVNTKSDADAYSDSTAKENDTYTHKKAYGEFKNVFLSDEEYLKITGKYSNAGERIQSLSAYIRSTGKTYLDHYAQLINWKSYGSTDNGTGAKPKPPGERREPTFDVKEFTKKAVGIKYVPPEEE